jgi:hypothetical protein
MMNDEGRMTMDENALRLSSFVFRRLLLLFKDYF